MFILNIRRVSTLDVASADWGELYHQNREVCRYSFPPRSSPKTVPGEIQVCPEKFCFSNFSSSTTVVQQAIHIFWIAHTIYGAVTMQLVPLCDRTTALRTQATTFAKSGHLGAACRYCEYDFVLHFSGHGYSGSNYPFDFLSPSSPPLVFCMLSFIFFPQSTPFVLSPSLFSPLPSRLVECPYE